MVEKNGMEEKMEDGKTLFLKINDFEGPLDLLYHLIEKNDMDIYDIPITEITRQYMEYISSMQHLNMEIASEFLVMASTLIHIKSRMLLPGKVQDIEKEEDPREELVVRLLQYRRCKVVASELKERFQIFSPSVTKLPETPKSMSISLNPPIQYLRSDAFSDAVTAVCNRNQLRFADMSAKITHILKRDKVSVKEKIKLLWNLLMKKKSVFFHEIFSGKNSTRSEKIAGFLAVLELLRSDKIEAKQKTPFDVILLKRKDKHDKERKEDILTDISSLDGEPPFSGKTKEEAFYG